MPLENNERKKKEEAMGNGKFFERMWGRILPRDAFQVKSGGEGGAGGRVISKMGGSCTRNKKCGSSKGAGGRSKKVTRPAASFVRWLLRNWP
jgi:hypothetical protein